MYKIAICDDDKRYRKTIREIIEHENSLPENEIRFYEYESGNELLKHTDILHELVFIDIRMPGLDGNQTALKLRNYNKDAVLIFYSSYFEPTVDSINFGQPFRYIMKDLHDTSLRREIAAIMTEVKRRFLNDYAVTVTSAGKIIRIHVENILYVSRAKRGCEITIVKEQEKETVRCREAFGELCEQLKDQGFAQAHYSYIVKLGKVEGLEKGVLHMCPYSIMHGTVQGHFSCSDSCSRGDIDYCLMKCLSTKIEDMSNLISSDWIRPEDLCYYEKLCEETDNFNLSIKLVERTKSTKFLTRVVEAYARRQYKGNLLDILLWPKSDDMVVKTEPTAEEMKTMAELYNISQMFNYSKIFDLPNIYIDNTKLDGFLKKFVDDYACNHKICVSKQNIDVTDSNYCSYCSSWVQRAIIYNGEQVEKWIDNCREFEKALDRSEVFRSVL